jgi:hypothetical protein
MCGRRVAVARWYHRIHLLPGWALRPICDRYDLSLGMTKDELRRTAPAPLPAGWSCPHLTVTASLPGMLTAPTFSYAGRSCGCEMQPVYATVVR